MNEHQLTVGAHLLLWGFPLLLTVLVIVDAIREGRRTVGES